MLTTEPHGSDDDGTQCLEHYSNIQYYVKIYNACSVRKLESKE